VIMVYVMIVVCSAIAARWIVLEMQVRRLYQERAVEVVRSMNAAHDAAEFERGWATGRLVARAAELDALATRAHDAAARAELLYASRALTALAEHVAAGRVEPRGPRPSDWEGVTTDG